MTRVITYIDGFNLYFGLRDAGFKRYFWLDLVALSKRLLKADQTLIHTHYFTSRIRAVAGQTDDVHRQNTYIDALVARGDLTVHEGHFLPKNVACRNCNATWIKYEEKKTDVNVAVQMLDDAYCDRFDTAILLSGDSDLTTPVSVVRNRFPNKRVVIALPPKRHSSSLQQAANAYFTIGEANIRQSQLPESIATATGIQLKRPATWK